MMENEFEGTCIISCESGREYRFVGSPYIFIRTDSDYLFVSSFKSKDGWGERHKTVLLGTIPLHKIEAIIYKTS